jgi:putative membrane-bound dehydrogenase-like protein
LAVTETTARAAKACTPARVGVQPLGAFTLRFCAAILTFHLAAVATAHEEPKNQISVDGVRFSLAEGLNIEKVAAEPLIKWPIVVDWDQQGRLVVAESGGVGWPIVEHNERKLHKIVRLVDHDGDGVFDERIVAADQLAFPEGVLCLGDDILVSAPPEIWKLTDNDGDGVCEDREVWFDGTTVTNCANDLHGPYLGRDGWIYWCKGAFGEQSHRLLDGRTNESSAAHIYRRRLSGGPIEPLISGGMDNPVEVAFTPEGEKFFTSTFLQHPRDGLRDGIAHAVYGGLFGKQHSVLSGHARTGPLMPIMTQLGPAAPSGLICLESDRLIQFPQETGGSRTLIAALFNLQKLTAHRLVPDGASYRTVDQDLVVADRVDFHPTDVIEDADGSLLLIDTGGWYDLCCPTSRIDQKTASGGIYRITNRATAATSIDREPVEWAAVDVGGAVPLLSDPRPWVRRRAGRLLSRAGNDSIVPLLSVLEDSGRSLDDRLRALWAICRLNTEGAVNAISKQLHQSDPSIVQAACHVVSMYRASNARETLEALLDHENGGVRRAAAEAIGRAGNQKSVDRLLHALEQSGDDRHLQHSILYALIEITRRHPTIQLTALADSDIKLAAAMIVLDQIGGAGQLDPGQVFVAAESDDSQLRQVALDVLSGHPEWASESLDRFNGLWSKVNGSGSNAAESLARIVAGWRNESPVQTQLSEWIAVAGNETRSRQAFLAENLSDFSPPKLPSAWLGPIAQWIEHADPVIRLKVAESLGRVEIESSGGEALAIALTRLAGQADSVDQRLRLLSALPKGHVLSNSGLEQETVSAFVGDDESLAPLASSALARIRLSEAAADRLADALPGVTSQSLMTAIEAIHRSGHQTIDRRMLEALSGIPTARTLPQQYLTNLYKRSPGELRAQAERTTDLLIRPPADVQATVDKMLAELKPGDPVRGLQVFRGNKAACSGCHRMGYIGKEVGPNLTHIGGSRTPAALLEALLFPSTRLEQSYQSSQVLLIDGQIHNGLITRRTGDSVELKINAQRQLVIAMDDIERIEPSTVSVMPKGLTELLTIEEISDLMSLLRSAK